MADFSDIGALLGLPANNEMAYQKGLALGANTQNALAQARQRVRENTKIEQLTGLADELGLTPAHITALQGGIDPRQITGAAGDIQERGFRQEIADPSVPLATANRRALAISGKPTGAYEAVGSRGYQDIFDPEAGIKPLPGGAASGGGDAAAIQVLRAFGFIDDTGQVVPGRERQAFDVMRTTGRTVDEGGVPGVIDFNPFAGAAAPAGVATDVSALVPPAPAAPSPAPASPVLPPAAKSAASTPAVAGAGATQPVSSAARVGANAAEIERQKVIGKGVGEATLAAPEQVAESQRLAGNIRQLLASPGFSGAYGNLQGQPGVRTAMGILDQDTANSQALLKNIDAQTFGIAIQKMRGLGQLSNAEGLKVTDAFTRAVNPLISEPDARAAWEEVLTYLDAAEARAMRKTQMPGTSVVPPGANATPATGVTPYADPAKEARYQAWKAAQGRQ